jgi:tetratricopeptide (TPR) repeat protein
VDRNLAIKKKAQNLIQKGQIDAALAEFDKLFESGDKDPYDFILVADLLAKRGSMQEAVRRYRQAVEEYGNAELFKNAIAVCKKILRISKEDVQIHRALGDLYAKEGLYGDAQIHYLEYADGSIRRQEHDAALDVLDLVISLSPDNEELSEKYVEIASRADQPERGGKELLRRADRAEQAGRTNDALELRDRASTLAPSMEVSPGAADLPSAERLESSLASGDDLGIVRGMGDRAVEDTIPADPSANGFETAASAMRPEAPGVIEPGVVSLDETTVPESMAVPDATEPTPESRMPVFDQVPPALVAPAAPADVAPADAADASDAPSAAVAADLAAADPAAAPPTHEELAASYAQGGNVELAVEEYWKAAELSFFRGDLPLAQSLLASLLGLAPHHEAALRRRVDITAQAEDRPAETVARYELAELYLAQEAWALARAEYLRVIELDHGNDRARGRVQRLDAMIQGEAPAIAPGVDFDSIDVPKPAASVRVRDESPINSDGLIDLEEIIDEFKQGISNSISGEDYESHYDLGMAYMEMGLHDEAISEFRIAQKGAPMELKCLEMIALCFLEKNEAGDAVRELTHALELPGHGPDETISIRYNLGMAHERLGNDDRALQHFEEVHLLNVDFLNVAPKVRELKQRLSGSRDRG